MPIQWIKLLKILTNEVKLEGSYFTTLKLKSIQSGTKFNFQQSCSMQSHIQYRCTNPSSSSRTPTASINRAVSVPVFGLYESNHGPSGARPPGRAAGGTLWVKWAVFCNQLTSHMTNFCTYISQFTSHVTTFYTSSLLPPTGCYWLVFNRKKNACRE